MSAIESNGGKGGEPFRDNLELAVIRLQLSNLLLAPRATAAPTERRGYGKAHGDLVNCR